MCGSTCPKRNCGSTCPERNSNPQAEGEVCESEFDIGLDQHVVIDMPDEVYVGMAVSSEIYDGLNTSCEYTKAAFESIEFVCEGDGC